jgi:hypothetical protein
MDQMKRLAAGFTLAMLLCGVGVVTGGAQGQGQDHGQGNQGLGGPPPVAEPPMGGIQWAKGQAGPGGGGSPLLVYHNGPIMATGAYVEPIFWGARWNDTSFVDKRNGLLAFYQGMNSSSYEATNTEYTQSDGAQVGTTITVGNSHVDLSASAKNGSRTSPILAEACAQATNLMTDGYYPVYIDQPRGHAGYCAWHSAGTCPNGTTIQFAFFFNLDGDAGCDPDDTSGQHAQGLAALANVSGHELSEALTDPHLNAWYDASGAENSDKCAWVFGTPLLTFSNGLKWKIQGNWSNKAFNAGTGFLNRDGQKGCLDGGNYK